MTINVPFLINLITILAVPLILGAIALFIYTILKKEREFQEREHQIFTQYQEIIQRAHLQAKQLLDATTATSERLLSEVKGTNEHLSEDVDKVFQDIATQHIQTLNKEATSLEKEYQEKGNSLQKQIDQNMQILIQQAQKTIEQQVTIFTRTLLNQAQTSSNAVDIKTKNMIAQVEKDIQDYKNAQLAKIDAQVMELVQKTYQDVLQRSIPEKVQRELILEALQKTKKEGLFTL